MPSTRRQHAWDRGAIAFAATCAVCLAFIFVAHYSTTFATSDTPLLRRHVSTSDLDYAISALNADEQCRQVHKAEDQCAFVHENCPMDDGGFSAIIDLYYCHFSHLQPLVLLVLVLWLALLFTTIGVAASDFFCQDLTTISQILGMGEGLTGVTLLALGNGSPDVFSTFAAMNSDSGSLAIGELFGAAGFIAAVVGGAMAVVRPFKVPRHTFVRDVGFFAAAAGFSMIFLWDGKLHFWECAVMVIYYLFFVVFVIGWHWWVDRKSLRREREAAARGHFINVEDEAEIENEAYRDDPDATPAARGVTREDWSALERGDPPGDNEYEDIEEGARSRWMSEFNNQMRLTRPTTRARRNTNTPIRPSLMGALEFQAVLQSLDRSRNIQTIPMDTRRHSDNPTHTTTTPQDLLSTASDPSIAITDEYSPLLPPSTNALAPPSAPVGRARAVSANDAASLRLGTQWRPLSPIQSEDNLIDLSHNYGTASPSTSPPANVNSRSEAQRPSPSVLIEPATPNQEAPIQQMRGRSPTAPSSRAGLLAPPDVVPVNRPRSDFFLPMSPSQPGGHSPRISPQLIPRASELPRIIIPRENRSPGSSRSTSPFPLFRESHSPSLTASSRSPSTRPPSLFLPDPLASPESIPVDLAEDLAAERDNARRPSRLERWWPNSVLPPPGNIISALFPAFYRWNHKSWYQRLVGMATAPAVFVLTLTLPVAENEEQEKGSAWNANRPDQDTARSRSDSRPHDSILDGGNLTGKDGTAAVATSVEQQHGNTGRNTPQIRISGESDTIEPLTPPPPLRTQDQPPAPELWDRWLTIIQLFLAPILIVLAIYMQASDDLEPRWLVRPILICLLVSTVLLIPLLLTTTPTYRPEYYRWILSSVGFVVAIAWISTIADQVVAALKALGVIIDMSHAIMGLTIFAIGNSCGDLAANIVVAQYGYPVMALSACFAGPMMNILLGIGLSGSYSLIRGEEKRRHKHPEKGIRFKSFHIEVSKTLIVSGITLLITLLALLIAVPMNKWVMDRKIGYGLIAVWTISTAFNVIIEVTGLLDEFEAFLLPFLGWLRG